MFGRADGRRRMAAEIDRCDRGRTRTGRRIAIQVRPCVPKISKTAARRRAGRGGSVSGSRGVGLVLVLRGTLPAMRDDGLAETQPQGAELFELALGEVGIPLRHELERVIHPLDLLLLGGADDVAAVDVAEELIARPIEQRFASEPIVLLTSQSTLLVVRGQIQIVTHASRSVCGPHPGRPKNGGKYSERP